jgi:3-phosphoshikimate 1-carboxyvinyltransferase
MKRIVAPLQKLGVDIQATEGQYAPLRIWQGEMFHSDQTVQIQSSTIKLRVASAQVKSCLLLASLAANGPVTVIEPGPSRDHTERMLASMGISIERIRLSDTHYQTTITPPQNTPLKPLSLTVPGDISSAAFLIIAALITPGSEITIRDVGLNPTRTGLLDALQRMGARIEISNIKERHGEPFGDLTVRYRSLHGTEVKGTEVVRMIDEFPAFAIAAAFAHGPTEVCDAQELRYKETDRIKSLCQQLHNVGVEIHEKPDGFSLPGNTPPRGGSVDPCGDHRLAMSLAIAGLASSVPIEIQDAAIIQESFPKFQKTLENLGAHIE